ncbi:unnamed protein product [Adineta steineri]|uniref:SMP-LTD domain-containing protein n=1 Tax=Adineta steineri TaxID=433720 RepID=A0A814W5H8_9BILA|nr:unnamed protein product [Adineta steineri]CAF3531372.1 unnamed protein product [Adineta steineri]
MSNINNDSHKKNSRVLEKLGQKITNFKEDIADNIERRRQSHNSINSNQIHYTSKVNMSDDSLVNEKKPPTPTENQPSRTGEDAPTTERQFSISQLAMGFGKKPTADTLSAATAGMVHSDSMRSFNDIFSTENSTQAKDLIMHGVRHELYRSQSRAQSESGSEEYIIHKVDPVDLSAKPTLVRLDKSMRKPTMLLAGPKFRHHTVEPEFDLKKNTIYPISGAVAFFALLITLWKPFSAFFSGFFVGFMIIAAIAYMLTRIYVHFKADESVVHEWIDFPELEKFHEAKTPKEDKHTTLHTCGEILFGKYDADQDDNYVRYPVVLRLENYHLTIQLPTQAKEEENKDREVRFVGHREYILNEANIMLVPEATMTRIKYWVHEYPIIVQDLKLLGPEIYSHEFAEKSKYDTDDFFNNTQTAISIFFETGPDKEDWFHKLSLVLRRGKEEIERATLASMGAPSAPSVAASAAPTALNMIAQSIPDVQIPTLGTRASEMQPNTTNLEERVQMKQAESVGPPYADTTATEKGDTEALRSQINEADIRADMAQARVTAQELRTETLEKEKEKDKKSNDKDADKDKDSTGSHQTASTKKKLRKQEENLERILDQPDCLDEAAITLNFLARRLLCDVFEEPLFKDLMKEKIELKLKEIAVSVLDDLHVETIDLGNTFPVILKVEPMQFNAKGIWFNLFFFYRGSFKITIKTRLVLQRLLNYNPTYDQPMYAQHHSGQPANTDEKIDDDDLLQRNKLLAKEPEIPENAAARKLGALLTKVAANKHFQRFAALKPVAGVIEKLSNAEVGAKVELSSFSGMMTINIPPPPSDRIWIGFPEMPDLNLKVTPVFGESKYSYTLIHDFLEARIRDEIKRMAVLPSMDDQLLPIFRDWVIDVIGEIASKPGNPLVDTLKSQTSFRDKFQEQKDLKELNRGGSSSPPEKPKSTNRLPEQSYMNDPNEELGEEMTQF